MSAAPIDIVATVGTWVAVGLAAVALLGIIAPYLVLKANRSDRNQALKEIDGKMTRYVRDYWKVTQSVRFRAVRVPILTNPPGQDGNPPGQDGNPPGQDGNPPGQDGNHPGQDGNPRADNTIVGRVAPELRERPTVLLDSTTGWVNLARLAEHQARQVNFGDVLLIRQKTAWFPIHRFWILALGLRGRYGHRPDRGENMAVRTTATLFTEVLDHTDEDVYLNSTTANKLYGTTGTIWWRKSLDGNEARFDEAYFAPHPDPIFEGDIDRRTRLDELFWLAVGCLPVRDAQGRTRRVYDVTFKSRRPVQSTGARRDNLPEADEVRFHTRSSLNANHNKWAKAMGAEEIKATDVHYIDMSPEMTSLDRGMMRIAESDMQKLALGVLQLSVTRQGFMLPAEKSVSHFFHHMCPDRIRTGRQTGVKKLFEKVLATDRNVRDHLQRLKDNITSTRNRKFSRQQASLCQELHAEILGKLGVKGKGLWVLAVLSLSNRQFFNTAVNVLEATGDNETPMIELAEGSVRIGDERYDLETGDLGIPRERRNQNRRTDARPAEQGGNELDNLEDVDLGPVPRDRALLALLWACVQIVAVDNCLDSTPLLQTVNRMTDVVHVSPSMSAPILHSSLQAAPPHQATPPPPQTAAAAPAAPAVTEPDADDNDDDERDGGADENRDDEVRRNRNTRGVRFRQPRRAIRPNRIEPDSEASSQTADTDDPYHFSSSEDDA